MTLDQFESPTLMTARFLLSSLRCENSNGRGSLRRLASMIGQATSGSPQMLDKSLRRLTPAQILSCDFLDPTNERFRAYGKVQSGLV
jgi:hypothetical protein